MKTNKRFLIDFPGAILILATINSCNAETKRPTDWMTSPEEHNESIGMQYFQEILDGKQYSHMPDVFTYDVVVHRPEGTLTYMDGIHAMFVKGLSPHTMETTIHEMIASGDCVSVRLSHKMTYSTEEAFLRSRLGGLMFGEKPSNGRRWRCFVLKMGRSPKNGFPTMSLGNLCKSVPLNCR